MLPLPARALLASDWLSMCVAHIKRAGMRVGVYLCVTPRNRTEWRVCLVRLGGCACLVRLAWWHDPIARAQLGSAEQPIGLLGLGLIPGLRTLHLTYAVLGLQCCRHCIDQLWRLVQKPNSVGSFYCRDDY